MCQLCDEKVIHYRRTCAVQWASIQDAEGWPHLCHVGNDYFFVNGLRIVQGRASSGSMALWCNG